MQRTRVGIHLIAFVATAIAVAPMHAQIATGGGVKPAAVNIDSMFQARLGSTQPSLDFFVAVRPVGPHDSAMVSFDVEKTGKVDPNTITVAFASSKEFENSLMSSIKLWRFVPGTAAGVPVSMRLEFAMGMAARPTGFMKPSVGPIPATSSINSKDSIYRGAAIGEQPTLLNSAEVEKALRSGIPTNSSAQSFSGTLNFVLDTAGMVEGPSVTIEEATSADFIALLFKLTKVMRFSPGKVGGKPVRVFVVMPVHYNRGG